MLLADPPTYVRSGIAEVGIAAVNGDGGRDWIAHVTCTFGLIQGSSRSQLVAYADNGAGSYTLIGQVVLTDGNSGLSAAEVSADGTVRAIVSGPYEPAGAITHEWHTYRWDGSGFVTVGSPEPIATPEPSNLTLTVSPSTVSGPQSVLTITSSPSPSRTPGRPRTTLWCCRSTPTGRCRSDRRASRRTCSPSVATFRPDAAGSCASNRSRRASLPRGGSP